MKYYATITLNAIFLRKIGVICPAHNGAVARIKSVGSWTLFDQSLAVCVVGSIVLRPL